MFKAGDDESWQVKPMKKQWAIIGCFLAALVFFSAMAVASFASSKTISEKENRALKAKPKWSVDNYFSGEYLRGWEDYIADHIPSREVFLQAATTLQELKKIESETSVVEVNADMGVASEDQNAPKQDMLVLDDRILEVYAYDKANCMYYVDTINKYAKWLPDDVRFYSMLVPTRIEYEEEKYRQAADSQKDALAMMNSKLAARATRVHVYDTLKKHFDEGLYFNTDHHWTALGAYYGARAFGKAADFEIEPLSEYTKKTTTGYLGYLYNQAPTPSVKEKPDNVDYYMLGDDNYRTTMYYYGNDGVTLRAFDDRMIDAGFSKGKGDYGIFLGGDYPKTVIHGGGPEGKVLAVVKDSYGNAFLPWLAPYFETIVAVDPRSYKGDMKELMAEYKVTDFLIMNYMKVTMSPGFIDQMNILIDPPKESLDSNNVTDTAVSAEGE